MTVPVQLGIPGLSLSAGDHVCAFYRGATGRDDVLLPYLAAGVLAGDLVTCVVDAVEPDSVLQALAERVDVEQACQAEQLEVLCSTDTYLSGGAFSGDRMISFWTGAIMSGLARGYPFARSVGEMTWALRDVPGVEDLLLYESELNLFLPRFPQVILCLYDLDRFSGETVLDILKTHPRVLLGGVVLDNPYYLQPDEYLASRR